MTTGAGSPIFVDTNVLVYANVTSSPLNAAARTAIQIREQTGVEIWISRQVLREYLAALTRPQAFGTPLPVSVVIAEARVHSQRFRMAEDNAQITENLLTMMAQIPMGGKQVHDANIVATMQAYGIGQLLTHNVADFNRFSHLITVIPL